MSVDVDEWSRILGASVPRQHYGDILTSRPPEDTVRAAAVALSADGVPAGVRTQDISGLGGLKVSLFKVTSAQSFNEWGRGATPEQALASALMERIERTSARMAGLRAAATPRARRVDLAEALSLGELGLCNFQRFLYAERSLDEIPMIYAQAFSVTRQSPVLVPATRVFLNPVLGGFVDYACSTGLSAHNTLQEAILQGASEVFERHFHHLATLNRRRNWLRVELTEIRNVRLAEIVSSLEEQGFTLLVNDIAPDFGMHAISILLFRENDSVHFRSVGAYSHFAVGFDLEIAVLRCITETALARAGATLRGQMTKELPAWVRRQATMRMRAPVRDARAYAQLPDSDANTELRSLIDVGMRHGLDICVSDLTSEELGIPAVRVIIPTLQPNFLPLGLNPTDTRARVTAHLDAYSEIEGAAREGRFADQSVVELRHQLTPGRAVPAKHGRLRHRRRSRQLASPTVRYEGREIRLPTPGSTNDLTQAIDGRESNRGVGGPFDVEKLATILGTAVGFKGYGYTHAYGICVRRHYPSGGSRHPLEVYVLADKVRGVTRGCYHYDAVRHVLTQVVEGRRWKLGATFGRVLSKVNSVAPAAVIAITAILERSRVKYGDHAERFALLEAGHLGQNLCLLAQAVGIHIVPFGGWSSERLVEILPVNPERELPVYLLGLGSDPSNANSSHGCVADGTRIPAASQGYDADQE